MTLRGPESMSAHIRKIIGGEYDVAYENPAPVILDIGANIGAFAAWAINRWPGATIHCYEPVPANFQMLTKNLAPIGAVVIPRMVAVGTTGGRIMYLGRDNCGEASFYRGPEQTEESIVVTTISPLALPSADILKLDVEGAEVEVLEGMAEIAFDVILMEYHSEAKRRRVDHLLKDYTLVGSSASCAHRGVVKYMRRTQ